MSSVGDDPILHTTVYTTTLVKVTNCVADMDFPTADRGDHCR